MREDALQVVAPHAEHARGQQRQQEQRIESQDEVPQEEQLFRNEETAESLNHPRHCHFQSLDSGHPIPRSSITKQQRRLAVYTIQVPDDQRCGMPDGPLTCMTIR